jgi:uncharacterized membrane protein YhaH (DUF805 family)
MSRGAVLSVQLSFTWLRGRLARKPYWIGVGLLVGVQAIAAKAAPEDTGWALLSDFVDILVAALISRRMRDFGWSPFWAWLGMAIVQIAVPVAFMIARRPSEATSSFFSDVPPVAENLTVVLFYILVGFAGLVRGNPGPNRYGPALAGDPPPGKQPAAVAESTIKVDAIIARALAAKSVAVIKTEANPGAAIAAPAHSPSSSRSPAFGKRR